MSALKSLMGKGLGRDDQADGPKPASIGAQYLKRMFTHMQNGDFEKAFTCLEKAQGVMQEEEGAEEQDEEDDAASYS